MATLLEADSVKCITFCIWPDLETKEKIAIVLSIVMFADYWNYRYFSSLAQNNAENEFFSDL